MRSPHALDRVEASALRGLWPRRAVSGNEGPVNAPPAALRARPSGGGRGGTATPRTVGFQGPAAALRVLRGGRRQPLVRMRYSRQVLLILAASIVAAARLRSALHLTPMTSVVVVQHSGGAGAPISQGMAQA